MTLKIQTTWRSQDWLNILTEEVEPCIKNITFTKCDYIQLFMNPVTRKQDVPIVTDYLVMIVVEDEFFEKQNFISILKDGITDSGQSQLKRDLVRGIINWVEDNLGHKIL